MKSVQCKLVVTTILSFLHLANSISTTDGQSNSSPSGQFPYHKRSTFVRLTINVPLNFSTVYGKLEPRGKEWFILFEIDHLLFPSTYPAINEDIQAGDATRKCRRFDAVREVEIELELHSKFVRIRAGNSERYEYPEAIRIGQEFSIDFFVQEYQEGALCLVGVQVDQLETSRFSLPTTSTTTQLPMIAEPLGSGQKMPSRRMLPNSATVTQTSRLWTGKVRFATYKMHHKNRVTMKPEQNSYIDIQKDRQVYETVQKSMTREINSVWSQTFIFFLTVEVIVISSFVLFGLTVFFLLQIRPKTSKHIEIMF